MMAYDPERRATCEYIHTQRKPGIRVETWYVVVGKDARWVDIEYEIDWFAREGTISDLVDMAFKKHEETRK